jgi:hypothetical protein
VRESESVKRQDGDQMREEGKEQRFRSNSSSKLKTREWAAVKSKG